MVIQRMFDYAGVRSNNPTALEEALRRDSQQGTSIAQSQQADVEPSAAALAEMQAAIDWHSIIDRPDFVVPGTLQL